MTFPGRSATIVISIIIAVAWLIAVVVFPSQLPALALGFIPARFAGLAIDGPAVPAILTPLTATLVHGGLLHLGFNLLIFVWCGMAIERVLGKTGLIALYLVGAYAAALAQWAVDPVSLVPMVGASGAISAVIGAYSLSFGRAKPVTRSPTFNRWLNALWLLVAWVLMQLMTGYVAGASGLLIATAAHIGGFAAGLLMQRPLLLWRYRHA